MNYFLVSDISLKRYNTLGLKSKAKNMLFPLNKTGVIEIYKKYKNSEIIIIGKGSNILLSKDYYDQQYIFVNLKLMDNIELNDDNIYVEAGATLSDLAWYTVQNNIKGYEFLEDIPGTVGGAIIMNAGTYQDTIGQLIDSITYYDVTKKLLVNRKTRSSDFSTRKTFWSTGDFLVISCNLKTSPGVYTESIDKLLEIKKQRYLKQPRNHQNAGSVFKRPLKDGQEIEVWKLIDNVGLKGFSVNDAMISDKHTGFIINKGNGRYEDIKKLIDIIQEEVKKKFNIELELEWKVI